MCAQIVVIRKKEHLFSLDSDIFFMLFNNTIVRRERSFFNALKESTIQYDDFLKLSRKGEVPYPLFFLNKQLVTDIIERFNKKVYFGVSKEQLSLSSRGDFNLSDISLILKDITRKQNYLKKEIEENNIILSRFYHTSKSIIDQAQEIRQITGYEITQVFDYSKERSFMLLDNGLAKLNVFISLHVHNYSPQNISSKLQFSGIAISDKKCPFLFIKAGDNDSKIELWGRRLFTAALLLSCLLHSDCRPVTMDGGCRDLITNHHYQFAEEFLMPESYFKEEICSSLIEVDQLARKYSVSPSAIVMRLFRLDKINEETKDAYLTDLNKKWEELRKSKGGGKKMKIATAILRYNNRAVVSKLLTRYDKKALNISDFRNLLCLKKGEHFDLEALRRV